ncbi:hypothetical protein OBBRIDRAFT_734375 [Obba rivulosa]|uniref:F-box domain-containing protein n=1 Tax=Obba rivulosa TaxID=1052685 RepID=A0A8E2AUP3_9APHY|nr:hypothetical protein OBBRIDRAFT_734375 [Obba rivulosa]
MQSPIYSLPVELLARIFHLGVLDAPHPDHAPPGHTFEVLVSHVCAHWRAVALHTSYLWTTIHFRIVPHLARARTYLTRNTKQLVDIFVDTCAQDDHVPGVTLFRDEFHPVFDIVLSHIARWRSLALKVRDLQCKAGARAILSSCGPAPALTSLQLWHIEDWGTSERLYTAIGPPPVVVFEGTLPALEHISLVGVNLPWARSPFLRGLRSIELALHSDDVRIPFDLWHAMLAASPALTKLALHYSGPRWGNPPWPPAPRIALPALAELRLVDLDPPYLLALLPSLELPAVRTLHLELPDQDFTPFVAHLAHPPAPPPDPAAALPLANGHAHPPHEALPPPLFPLLEELSLPALQCRLDAWRGFVGACTRVARLEADFARMPEGFFDELLRAPAEDVGMGKGKGKARACDADVVLPALETLRVTGVPGAQLCALHERRARAGCPVRLWLVNERGRDEGAEELERRVNSGDGEERFEWFRDEEVEDEDDEGEYSGEEDEDEDDGTDGLAEDEEEYEEGPES